jgi:hypothetical protein
MVNYEELLKSKDAEIEMLRNICATLKTALNMELKFQRNNAKSFAEFKAPLLKKEEPIKIHVEVKPKTSDEIFAERLARAMAFRQTMDNAEKDLQMKSQMQTVKQTLKLSRQLKQKDLDARLAAESKAKAEFEEKVQANIANSYAIAEEYWNSVLAERAEHAKIETYWNALYAKAQVENKRRKEFVKSRAKMHIDLNKNQIKLAKSKAEAETKAMCDFLKAKKFSI